MAVAMFALTKAFNQREPTHPKAYISQCIDNAVVDLLENNYIIKVPRSEIQRRKKNDEPLDDLPRAVCMEGHSWDRRASRAHPVWTHMHAADVRTLLTLTEREGRILDLRIEGYTNAEIGLEFSISEAAIRKSLTKLAGRYMELRHKHKGLLKPNE